MNKILTAYDKKTLYDTFLDNVFFLELYILKENNKLDELDKEKWGDRWENWGKLWKEDSPKEIKGRMYANLFGFRIMLKMNAKKEGLLETRKELKKEFYKWIDIKEINAENCSPKLKNILLNFYEVLKGRGDEWAKKLFEKSDKRWEEKAKNLTDEERQKEMGFNTINENLGNEDQKAEQLEGKNWDEIVLESKFNGNEERGKRTFKQIKLRESPASPQKEQTAKRESENVNHSEEANKNKEFPWKIAILLSLLSILATVVMVVVWKKRKQKNS